MPWGQEPGLRVHAAFPSPRTLPSMNEHVQGIAKSKVSRKKGVKGKTGKISRTKLCGQDSDCQVQDLGSFVYKAKGFKHNIDMVKLAFQED